MQLTEDAIQHEGRRSFRLMLDLALRLPVEHAADFAKDVRYGLRSLAAAPGFTLCALLSLGLGICIATCAISEVNGIVFRDIPEVARPGELVATQLPISYPVYERFRTQAQLFARPQAGWLRCPSTSRCKTAPSESGDTWSRLRLFRDLGYSARARLPVRCVVGKAGSTAGGGIKRSLLARTLRCRSGHRRPDAAYQRKVCHCPWRGPGRIPGCVAHIFRGRPVRAAHDGYCLRSRAEPRPPGNVGPTSPQLWCVSPPACDPPPLSLQAEAALDAIARQFNRDQGMPAKSGRARRTLLTAGGKAIPLRSQDIPLFGSILLILAGLVMLIACASVANMKLARAAARRRGSPSAWH